MKTKRIGSVILAGVLAVMMMIIPKAQPKALATGETVAYISNVKYSVYLRQTPSMNSYNICEIPVGTMVWVVERNVGDFTCVDYFAKDGSKRGYVLTKYLSIVGDSQASYSGYGTSDMYVSNVKYSIYLRTSPSDSGSVITEIPLGARVTYLGNAGNGFYKISYNGRTGYSKSQYLTSGGTRTMRVSGVKYSIYLRSTPSQDSYNIMEIPVGATVTYLGDAGNGFYKISYNGKTGYGTAAYLR